MFQEAHEMIVMRDITCLCVVSKHNEHQAAKVDSVRRGNISYSNTSATRTGSALERAPNSS